MTEPAQDTSVSSAVEVAVDPETAFTAFTEELDLWWVRGPINHHAAGRALAMRCEPGVGGRLLEVYNDTTGEALELARITAWEPGKRLAWTSSIDDVRTEVQFEPSAAGTYGVPAALGAALACFLIRAAGIRYNLNAPLAPEAKNETDQQTKPSP